MTDDSRRVIVDIKGVAKHYGEGETRVDALRNLDLRVHAGEVVALLGPSGSGKTTLLNMIGCIINPSEGQVSLDGELVYDTRWLRSDLRRLRLDKIGFIFQAHNLLPFLNATDNVALVLELAGKTRAEAQARAQELLDYLEVGMGQRSSSASRVATQTASSSRRPEAGLASPLPTRVSTSSSARPSSWCKAWAMGITWLARSSQNS